MEQNNQGQISNLKGIRTSRRARKKSNYKKINNELRQKLIEMVNLIIYFRFI